MKKVDLVDRHSRRLAKLHSHISRKTNFFPGQRVNEEVKLCIRTHWLRGVTILAQFLLIGFVIPVIILFLLSFVKISGNLFDYSILALSIYLLFIWLFTFVEFLKSELTVVVVTSERVVNIVRVNLFDQQISETNLDRIQEITGSIHGFLGTFLDLGKLEIQTAGSDLPLVMNFVKSPQLTARKILDTQKMGQNRRRAGDFGRRKDDKMTARSGENLPVEKLKEMRKNGEMKEIKRRDQNPI